MSVVADLSVSAAQFALGDTLSAAPDVEVEFERVVTHSQEWIMPFLWVSGGDIGTFENNVDDDHTVSDARIADEFEVSECGRIVLYRIRWSEGVKRTVNVIWDRKGTLVQAVGSQRRWDLKVRFETHTSLSELQTYFEQADVGFTVERVYTQSKPSQPEFNVTAAQRKALVKALEDGYFDIPRQTTISKVADGLNISTNALSERLRRGTANLVRTTLRVQNSMTEQDTNGS